MRGRSASRSSALVGVVGGGARALRAASSRGRRRAGAVARGGRAPAAKRVERRQQRRQVGRRAALGGRHLRLQRWQCCARPRHLRVPVVGAAPRQQQPRSQLRARGADRGRRSSHARWRSPAPVACRPARLGEHDVAQQPRHEEGLAARPRRRQRRGRASPSARASAPSARSIGVPSCVALVKYTPRSSGARRVCHRREDRLAGISSSASRSTRHCCGKA